MDVFELHRFMYAIKRKNFIIRQTDLLKKKKNKSMGLMTLCHVRKSKLTNEIIFFRNSVFFSLMLL